MRSNDGEGEPGKGLNAMFNLLNKKDRTPPALPEGTVRRRYSIEGQVQGVGFRYRARYAAQTLELTGWVENEDDGSVTLEVQGDPDKFMRSGYDQGHDPDAAWRPGRDLCPYPPQHRRWHQ